MIFQLSVVDCKHPGTIENGRVIIMNDTTTYNSAAEYHCVPHFQRIGPYMRKCLDDGNWSGEKPSCQCKHLKILILIQNQFLTVFVYTLFSNKCSNK